LVQLQYRSLFFSNFANKPKLLKFWTELYNCIKGHKWGRKIHCCKDSSEEGWNNFLEDDHSTRHWSRCVPRRSSRFSCWFHDV